MLNQNLSLVVFRSLRLPWKPASPSHSRGTIYRRSFIRVCNFIIKQTFVLWENQVIEIRRINSHLSALISQVFFQLSSHSSTINDVMKQTSSMSSRNNNFSTEIVVKRRMMTRVNSFTAGHPFLFLTRDQELLIFAGRVENP